MFPLFTLIIIIFIKSAFGSIFQFFSFMLCVDGSVSDTQRNISHIRAKNDPIRCQKFIRPVFYRTFAKNIIYSSFCTKFFLVNFRFFSNFFTKFSIPIKFLTKLYFVVVLLSSHVYL